MQAKTDHTDLVSRRMGFIPLPLACLVRGVWSRESGCGLVIGGWTVSSHSLLCLGAHAQARYTVVCLCVCVCV